MRKPESVQTIELCKKCYCCKEVKCLSSFGRNKSKKDGLNDTCKICITFRSRKAREKDPEKAREATRRYYKNNPEKVLETQRKFYESNHDHLMVNAARFRAKKKGIPFDINYSDITIPELCPVLGIPLIRNEGRPKPNSPSLDKIIPELGYVKGNIIVMSHKANTMKNDASLSDLVNMGKWAQQILQKKNYEAETSSSRGQL